MKPPTTPRTRRAILYAPRRACASHFGRGMIQTRKPSVRYSAVCDRRHGENPEPCLRFMRERYGGGVVEELEGMRDDGREVTDEHLLRASGQLREFA